MGVVIVMVMKKLVDLTKDRGFLMNFFHYFVGKCVNICSFLHSFLLLMIFFVSPH
jgi:hypothetical protein